MKPQAVEKNSSIRHVLKPGTPEHRNTGTPEHQEHWNNQKTPEQRI